MNSNQKLVDDVLKLMELSSMDSQERAMWTVVVPTMEEAELQKFYGILKKETDKLNQLLDKAQKEKNGPA